MSGTARSSQDWNMSEKSDIQKQGLNFAISLSLSLSPDYTLFVSGARGEHFKRWTPQQKQREQKVFL